MRVLLACARVCLYGMCAFVRVRVRVAACVRKCMNGMPVCARVCIGCVRARVGSCPNAKSYANTNAHTSSYLKTFHMFYLLQVYDCAVVLGFAVID